jgi:hypothetical protein
MVKIYTNKHKKKSRIKTLRKKRKKRKSRIKTLRKKRKKRKSRIKKTFKKIGGMDKMVPLKIDYKNKIEIKSNEPTTYRSKQKRDPTGVGDRPLRPLRHCISFSCKEGFYPNQKICKNEDDKSKDNEKVPICSEKLCCINNTMPEPPKPKKRPDITPGIRPTIPESVTLLHPPPAPGGRKGLNVFI